LTSTGADRKSQLRSFGFVVGGGFCLIGLWPAILHGQQPRLWAIAVAALLALLAVASPNLLSHFHQFWMFAGEFLGRLNSRLVLGILFFALFVPFGFVMRLLGKDPMRLKVDPDSRSYRLPSRERSDSHLEHQY
jgi:hypothetical protein